MGRQHGEDFKREAVRLALAVAWLIDPQLN